MLSRFRVVAAVSVLAAAGSLSVAAGVVTASAAPAAPTSVPRGWTVVPGGIDEAAYCAAYSPPMGVTHRGDGWQCTLIITAPTPPGGSTTIRRDVNQTDACKFQYPGDVGVKAFNTAPRRSADPYNYWNCYLPPATTATV